MCKFKITLVYNKEEVFTKIEFLDFKITISFAKLDIVGSRLVSNGLIFSDDIPVLIQLVTILLLWNVSKLSIGTETKKNTFYPTKKHIFSLIFAQLYLLDQLVFFSSSTYFVLFGVASL